MILNQAQRLGVKTGDQLVFEAKDIVGHSIGFFTNSKYSHVGTIIVIGGFVFVLEAVQNNKGGVRLISLWDCVENRKVWLLKLKTPLLKEQQLLNDLDKITDKKYAKKKNFLKHILINDRKYSKIIKKIFPSISIKEKLNEHICSGLSTFIYEKYHTLKEINYATVVPDDYVFNPDKKLDNNRKLIQNLFQKEIIKLKGI